MDRRAFAIATSAIIVAGPASAQRGPSRELLFAVTRDGSPIGWHRVGIAERDGATDVTVDIELDVKLAFIQLYRYRHANREMWDDAGLVRLSSRTDDNGTPWRVEAARDGAALRVEGGGQTQAVPLDTRTTTYWHPGFVRADRWIDTQRGRVLQARVTPSARERISAGGAVIEAVRYRLGGELELDIWFDEERWVGLLFKGSDGSAIRYELVPPGTPVALLAR